MLSIELDPRTARTAEANLLEAGLAGHCSVAVGDGACVVRETGEPIDLLFLDGAKEEYSDYLDGCWDRLHDGSVIISDNVFFDAWLPSTGSSAHRAKHRAFVERIVEDPGLQTHLLPDLETVALSVRVSAPTGSTEARRGLPRPSSGGAS